MTDLTREQIEEWRVKIKRKIFYDFNDNSTQSRQLQNDFDALCDMAMRACDAPEVAKDAERYRWLRDSCGDTEPPDGIGFISRGIHWQAFGAEGKATTFDAAIDAAMQAGSKP